MKRKRQWSVVGDQWSVKNHSLLTTDHRPLTTALLIIGHRGAAAVAPENTLVSFEQAINDGADGIEFDVRLAGDCVPVVIHDPTLRRTAMREGRIADIASSELCRTDVGTWFNLRHPTLARADYATVTIPTLARVFEAFGETTARFYVEMKSAGRDREALAAEVARLVRTHSLMDRVVVESFDLAAIVAASRIEPRLRTAALFDRKLSRPAPSMRWMIERALGAGAAEIALHRSLASQRAVQAAARRNLATVVWTVDSTAWIGRAIKRGVVAIITNNPGRLCAHRAKLLDAR